MNNKILFIAYNSAKKSQADAIQNDRLVGALREICQVDIVTRSGVEEPNVIRVDSPNLRIIDRVLYRLFPWLYPTFSIDRKLWAWCVYRSIKKRMDGYQKVYISYEPYSISSLPIKLHKNCKINIVSIFYDPLVENIFWSENRYARYLRKKKEKQVVSTSEMIVVNNDKYHTILQSKYPESRIVKINLCGNDNSVELNGRRENNDKVRIVHAGNVFGKRSLKELNSAVTFAKEMLTDIEKHLEIVFYGKFFAGEEDIIACGNNDVIKFKGSVTAEVINKELSMADALLLIDPMSENNVSFPSKLAEYVSYQKPILAFSATRTPSYVLLKKLGQYVCGKGEERIMAENLVELTKNGFLPIDRNQYDEAINSFTPSTIAQQYLSLSRVE